MAHAKAPRAGAGVSASAAAVIPFAALAADILGNVFWGLSNMFTRVALASASPTILLSHRFVLSFFILLLLMATGRFELHLKGKHLSSALGVILCMPVYYFLESRGILYTNASFAGMLISVVPVVSIVVAIIMLREYPTRKQVFLSILPIVGVMLISYNGSALGVVTAKGALILGASVLVSAIYRVVNKLSSAEYTFFERTFFVVVACAFFFTVQAAAETGGDLGIYFAPLRDRSYLLCMLFLAVFCSTGANLLVNYAIPKMPVVVFSAISSVSTICSLFSGILFLHEPFNGMMLFGAALILFGIWQVSKS